MHELNTITKTTSVKSYVRHEIKVPSLFNQFADLWTLVDNNVVDEATAQLVNQGSIKALDLSNRYHKSLIGDSPIVGLYITGTKEILSFTQAYLRGIIEREVALQLLQAQSSTGGIVELNSNRRLRVGEAYIEGTIPREFIQPLERAEKAVLGFIRKESGRVLNILESKKVHLISEQEAYCFLQSQMATGGIIVPKKYYRIPNEMAIGVGSFWGENRINRFFTSQANRRRPSYKKPQLFIPDKSKNKYHNLSDFFGFKILIKQP